MQMPATSARPRLATTQEVATYLGVPVRTIWEWNYKGTGPRCTRVGKYLRFRWEDVDAWLASQQTKGGTAA